MEQFETIKIFKVVIIVSSFVGSPVIYLGTIIIGTNLLGATVVVTEESTAN